jgi:hypothetical protein
MDAPLLAFLAGSGALTLTSGGEIFRSTVRSNGNIPTQYGCDPTPGEYLIILEANGLILATVGREVPGRTMSSEQRQNRRFKITVPVEILPEGSESPVRCGISDLSIGGCYVESMFPFPNGTRLELKVQLDDTLLIIAKAVTCDPQVGNGIKFLTMLPEDLEQLRAFLDSVAQQDEAEAEKKAD